MVQTVTIMPFYFPMFSSEFLFGRVQTVTNSNLGADPKPVPENTYPYCLIDQYSDQIWFLDLGCYELCDLNGDE